VLRVTTTVDGVPGAWMRSVPAALLLPALLVTACTSGNGTEREGERSGEPTSTSTTTTLRNTQPLALAVNVRRPPLDVSEALARRLVRGEVRSWSALGLPATPLTVTRDRSALLHLPMNTVAAIPASELLPSVRVVDVAGVHPLREPARYQLRTSATTMQPVVTTMTVVGDIMLGRRVGERAAEAGDPAYPLRLLRRRLASADLTVGDLESTLSRAGAPTQGGDSFAADPRVAAALVDAGFDALGLANNHLGDFGPRALTETVRRLRGAGLSTFGAGRSPREAWRPAVVTRNGVRFGFLGFNAIGETPEVARGRPGAVSISMPPRTGPLDRRELDRFLDAVRRLDRAVDVVVVLPHWGTQYTNRPEPVQHTVATALVAAGADVVVGGHPHWVQGSELVDRRLVVHSLGNFVFDMDFMTQTQEGLVLELVLWGDEVKAAEVVPYRIGADLSPRLVPWEAATANLALFWEFTTF
jgi:poly-gamma-glutamate capsule biosynthesis protein CapA/YwtB (metallophosphatase superfamily)